MTTPEEVFGSRRTPEEVFGDVTVGGEPVKKPLTSSFFKEMEIILSREEPGVDYASGIDDLGFRAKLGRADNEIERVKRITEKFGEGNASSDRFGNYIISVEGLKNAGIEADKPRAIDEKGLTFMDLADISGDAPAIAAGTVAGLATGGMGAIPAIAITGASTAAGKAIGELGEQLAGENMQPAGEVVKDVAKEGALGATGEGIFRTVLGPLGRKIMAPEAKRMTDRTRQLAEEARSEGLKPSIMQISKPPIVGRTLSVADRIFGDPNAEQNSRALNAWIVRLKGRAGTKPESLVTLGEDIKDTITKGRKALSKWANDAYTNIEAMAGGQPIVPTSRLKGTAQEFLDKLPANEAGKPILTPPETTGFLTEIAGLPDNVTVSQMQAIRTRLREIAADNTLTPGFSSTMARRLAKNATEEFSDAATNNPGEIGAALKLVDERYAKKIRKFDNAFIQRLAKSEKFAGEVPPELVVDTAFRKGRSTNVKRMMELLPEAKRQEVRRVAIEDILENIQTAPGDKFLGSSIEGLGVLDPRDPLTKVFNGKKLLNSLDNYGPETLNEMFGKEMTSELYKLGRVTAFMTEKQGEFGGLVAAGIATRPLQNLGRLAKLNIVSHLLNTKTGIKYLTDGFSAPNFRKGSTAVSKFFTQLNLLASDNTKSDDNERALEIN